MVRLMSYHTRARARPQAYDYRSDEVFLNGTTVHEPEDDARYTGLLDRHGNGIYHVPERNPIGFVHAYERAKPSPPVTKTPPAPSRIGAALRRWIGC
jgi:hypothetical protein